MPRPAARRLSQRVVIDAALGLTDRDGHERVSVRALARELQLPPMTLYGHFRDKAALYDAMRERAFEQVFTTTLEPTWRRQLDAMVRNIVRRLRAHPRWLALLTAHDGTPTPPMMAYFDHLHERMLSDGFTREHALHATAAAMSFAWGILLSEHMFPCHGDPAKPSPRVARIKQQLASPSGASLKSVAAVMEPLERWAFDDVLELGLLALIDGIASRCVRPRR